MLSSSYRISRSSSQDCEKSTARGIQLRLVASLDSSLLITDTLILSKHVVFDRKLPYFLRGVRLSIMRPY